MNGPLWRWEEDVRMDFVQLTMSKNHEKQETAIKKKGLKNQGFKLQVGIKTFFKD